MVLRYRKSMILFALLFSAGCATRSMDPPNFKDIESQTISELQDGISDKHPISYIILAIKTMDVGSEYEAASWYYVGQIRHRAYLKANPGLDP